MSNSKKLIISLIVAFIGAIYLDLRGVSVTGMFLVIVGLIAAIWFAVTIAFTEH